MENNDSKNLISFYAFDKEYTYDLDNGKSFVEMSFEDWSDGRKVKNSYYGIDIVQRTISGRISNKSFFGGWFNLISTNIIDEYGIEHFKNIDIGIGIQGLDLEDIDFRLKVYGRDYDTKIFRSEIFDSLCNKHDNVYYTNKEIMAIRPQLELSDPIKLDSDWGKKYTHIKQVYTRTYKYTGELTSLGIYIKLE